MKQLTVVQKLEAIIYILESVPMETRAKFCGATVELACELATKERLKGIDGKENEKFCIYPLTGKRRKPPKQERAKLSE